MTKEQKQTEIELKIWLNFYTNLYRKVHNDEDEIGYIFERQNEILQKYSLSDDDCKEITKCLLDVENYILKITAMNPFLQIIIPKSDTIQGDSIQEVIL